MACVWLRITFWPFLEHCANFMTLSQCHGQVRPIKVYFFQNWPKVDFSELEFDQHSKIIISFPVGWLELCFAKNMPVKDNESGGNLFWRAGLRSRSRGRSWSRSESTVLPGVGVGAGVSEISPTPTTARRRVSNHSTRTALRASIGRYARNLTSQSNHPRSSADWPEDSVTGESNQWQTYGYSR